MAPAASWRNPRLAAQRMLRGHSDYERVCDVKGILLAGGTGSRLNPTTTVVNKHLLPVFDQPMINYPLGLLARLGVTEVLLVTGPADVSTFRELIEQQNLKISVEYAVQSAPLGIPEALVIGEEFLDGDATVLMLGDNIFDAPGLPDLVERARKEHSNILVGTRVSDPHRFGTAVVDDAGRVLSVEEKPPNPSSNVAVTGLYIFAGDAPRLARTLAPSERGELEILDLAQHYLDRDDLGLVELPPSADWFDAGTHESLLDAACHIATRRGDLQGEHLGLTASCMRLPLVPQPDPAAVPL